MKLESQVTSLELSIKLKELNVKQKSFFVWEYYDAQCYAVKFIPYAVIPTETNGFKLYSAFTVGELGEMLPNYVLNNDPEPFNGFRIFIEKFISIEDNIQINNWIINYHCDTVEVYGKQEFFTKRLTKNIYDPSLANAMAKMLIYLIENGLVKV